MAVAALLALWALLPEVIVRLTRRRPLAVGAPLVALSFDDGPDPDVTPEVLRVLADQGVRASFFLSGQRADLHRELVRSATDAGHELGVHGYTHRHAWLLGPAGTWLELQGGRDALQRATDTAPRLYRPPWGMVSLATVPMARRLGLRTVLYDVESGDWRRGRLADAVADAVMQRARPGSIILLHDGARDAERAQVTLAALPEIICRLRERGLEFATVGELLERARRRPLLLRVWVVWERLFARLTGVMELTETIHLARTRYHGPPLEADGQVLVRSGARCLDIHFANLAMSSELGDRDASSRVSEGLRAILRDFGRIGVMLRDDPRFADVEALIGTALFHRPAGRMGFHVQDVPSRWRRRALSWYARLIRRMYGGQSVGRSLGSREVRFVWMTRQEFIERFAPERDAEEGRT